MATRSSTDVVVAGGGIGGLTTAYALATAGFSVRVLEKAPEFGEVGAGLQLAPNATRVLREWGLLDDVIAAGVLPRRLVISDGVSGGELIQADPNGALAQRYGAPYVVVHRSDLHSILVEACRRAGVALETARSVERVDSTADAAFAYCADGSVHEGQVVVAADGLTSALRESFVDDKPICSGFVAYRGAIPISEVSTKVRLDDVVAWIGPNCHFVQYPLRRGEIFNQVAVFGSPAYARGDADWGGPEELDEAFSRCCEHVRRSLPSLWRDRRWPMYDRLPTDNWVSGRLVLTGDAAHPMLQYLAQGACQAIEDAYVLAREALRTADWDKALAAFNDIRAPKTAHVQRTARSWGDIWHVDGTATVLRNELFTTLPDLYRHTDWLYGES